MSGALEHVFAAIGCHDEAEQRAIAAALKQAGVLENTAESKAVKTPPPSALVLLDPSHIQVDAATYQFRVDGDKHGVTRQYGFMDTDHWNPVLHGDPLLVHERLDGDFYVADGHHRLDFAQRLHAAGQEPRQVAALLLREADGYTAQDARIIAAYKNMARGRTDPVDAARVFKEARKPAVHADLLPTLQMDNGNLRLSYTLSGLSDKALDFVAAEKIPAAMAADIAVKVAEPERQESVLRIVSAKLKQAYDTNMPSYTPAGKYAAQVMNRRARQASLSI